MCLKLQRCSLRSRCGVWPIACVSRPQKYTYAHIAYETMLEKWSQFRLPVSPEPDSSFIRAYSLALELITRTIWMISLASRFECTIVCIRSRAKNNWSLFQCYCFEISKTYAVLRMGVLVFLHPYHETGFAIQQWNSQISQWMMNKIISIMENRNTIQLSCSIRCLMLRFTSSIVSRCMSR